MAADNRNFVNKFANEGGGDVLVEDKRLEELKGATAKTAGQISTTTDYIPLQDVDGNFVKINAASFQEAVRNTLGSLLANNDKGTTISGLPALSGSGAGLDFGSITPANLASVLGVGPSYSEDLDNAPVGPVYAFPNAGHNPASDYCIVFTYGTQFGDKAQCAYNVGTNKANYSRSYDGSSWSPWQRVDNFGCNTPSDLAELLGASLGNKILALQVYGKDLDDLIGFYYCTTNCSHSPADYSWLISLAISNDISESNDIAQLAFNLNNIYWRRKSGTWSEWKSVL